MKPRWLVLGYGNELRGDDAVGVYAVREVESWHLPGVKALAVHQLTPELVEHLMDVERVLFVDAQCDAQGVELRRLQPESRGSLLGHAGHPGSLLVLADVVQGRHPEAWLLTIPAGELDFGAELSAGAKRGLEEALQQIRRLTEESLHCTKSA